MPPLSISKPGASMSVVESSENGLGNVKTPRRKAVVTQTPKNLSRAFRDEPFRPSPSPTVTKQQQPGLQMKEESNNRGGRKGVSKRGLLEKTPSHMLRQLSKFLANQANPLPQTQPRQTPRPYQLRSTGRPVAADILSSKRKSVKTPTNSSYVANLMSQKKKSVGKPGKVTKDVTRNTETPQEMLRVLSRMPGFKPKTPSIVTEEKEEEKEKNQGREAAQSVQTTEREASIDNNFDNESEIYVDIEEIVEYQKTKYRRGNDFQESGGEQAMKKADDFAGDFNVHYEDDKKKEKDLGDQREMEVDDNNEYIEPDIFIREDSSAIESDSDVVKRRESSGMQLGFMAIDKDNSTGQSSSSKPLKHQTARTRTKKPQFISKAGCPVPSLPNNLVKQLFGTFSKTKVSQEAMEVVYEGTRTFFEQIAEDLAIYTEHGGRKVISQDDMVCLFQRQRRISEKFSIESLAQRFLPRELSDEICTSALSKVQHN